MKKKRTSKHYFRYTPMEVYEAVTDGSRTDGLTFIPMEEEVFDHTTAEDLKSGKMIARITDRTPGKSCSYEIRTKTFTLYWSASFSEVQGECLMTMTETYDFEKNAFPAYILAVLFFHQKQQHTDYFRTIHERLKQNHNM